MRIAGRRRWRISSAARRAASPRGWAGGRPSTVTVPTLLVTSDDQFFTEEMLRRRVAVRFKRIRIGAIHGAGHYPHLERPVELAGLIARFLSIPAPPTTVETRIRSGSRS